MSHVHDAFLCSYLVQEIATPSSDGVLWRREDPQPGEDPQSDDFQLRDMHTELPAEQIAQMPAHLSSSNGSGGWTDVDEDRQPLLRPPTLPQLPSPWDAPEFYSSAPVDSSAAGGGNQSAAAEADADELFSPEPTPPNAPPPPVPPASPAVSAAIAWDRGDPDNSREEFGSVSSISTDASPSSATDTREAGSSSRTGFQASPLAHDSSAPAGCQPGTGPPEAQASRSEATGKDPTSRDLSEHQEDVSADKRTSADKTMKINGSNGSSGSTIAADATHRTPRREMARVALLDNVEDEEELAADSVASLAGQRARIRRRQRHSNE